MSCDMYDISCWFAWLIEEIKLLYVNFLDLVLGGVAFLFESFPVPEFMTSYSITLPSGVLFFTDLLRLNEGLSIVFAAYVFRFVLRRIPGLG